MRSLVLGATTTGGEHAVAASQDVQDFLGLRERMTAETAVWASVPINYATRTRLEHGDRIVGAAHLSFTDDERLDREVADWLSARTSRDPSAPPHR